MKMKKKVKMTVFLPEDLWEKVSIMAIKKRMSKNRVIVEILRNALEDK